MLSVRRWLCVLIAASAIACVAQTGEDQVSWDGIADAAQRWAEENLDEAALDALRSDDRDKVRGLLKRLEQEFGGEYVLDLAALKQAATVLVPLMEQYEETYPYALWLKTRLDYFEVAEELTPPKPPETSTPVKNINPRPDKQREIWITKTSKRPWPARATEFVPRLKPIFESEKIPDELIWIAEVESSFDPRARSPVGAAGLFQLMPDTAKRYGLRTAPTDQRLHPGDSARAAAQYLRFLYRKFKDWRLALAAYNCGEGRVERLLAKHKAKTYDGIAVYLPAETQMYVPKIEATLLNREGIKLAQLR